MTSATANRHREIERRFLIETIPIDLKLFPRIAIEQGYIARHPVVRLRSENGKRFLLTVKSGGLANREEREIDLTIEQFSALWPFTAGFRLSKTRHCIPWEKHILEIDHFLGPLQGLCIGEVEFPDEESMAFFQPPEWFGKEITDDPHYSNSNLAKS